ncbi:MAG TPA: BMC domain-containing protein [Candidatus Avimonas sp.]|nr:BMC domain-containing protein [Clostridiales bacterium]HPU59192.1 BMC domain-containing protein [Candidatus Avimonas sp.]
MKKAIGMAEFITVSEGIAATDRMIKTAEIDVIEAQTVCPGKYIVIISGEISAVNAAVEAAKTHHGAKLIDSFVLGNPHESIFPAIYSNAEVTGAEALGVMETFSAASAIFAADAAAKTALVELIELRLARGMCGKSYLMLTGSVAAVTAAIERANAAASERGMFLDSTVIPNPDKKLWKTIL